MSLDAAREPEQDSTPYARVKKQPRDIYTALFMGSQRKPAREDELGAIAVIDLVLGDRVLIWPCDAHWRRVEIRRDR